MKALIAWPADLLAGQGRAVLFGLRTLAATPAAFAHHSHRVGLPDLHDMKATASLAARRRDGSDFDGKRRGGAKCLFVTLREPAARRARIKSPTRRQCERIRMV